MMLPSAAGMPGMITRNTITAPCSVKNWLYVSCADDRLARRPQLGAHQQRERAAEQQREQDAEQVHHADPLVIEREGPALPSLRDV